MIIKRTKLANLFHITSSKRVLKSQWKNEGIPFYRGREITKLATNGFVHNELFISESDYAEYALRFGIPKSGDIVVTAIGTIGNSYIIKADDKFYFKDASVLWLKKISKVNSEFINYWFRSPQFFEQLNRGNGATVDTLSITKLKSVSVFLPPLAEQKRIVAILDEAFAAIATATANAERNLVNARAVFENYRNSALSSKDHDWRMTSLGDVCHQFQYGSSAKSQPKGSVPVLRMGNIQDGEIDWTNLVYTSNMEEIEKYRLHPNDVLFNRTNSAEHVGKTAIFRGGCEAVFAGYLIRIGWNPQHLEPEYLNHYLNSEMARAYGRSVMSQSVNQANINATKLKSYPFIQPPLETQQRIVKDLYELKMKTSTLVTLYQRKLDLLAELKQAILHKAFTGELTADPQAADRLLAVGGVKTN